MGVYLDIQDRMWSLNYIFYFHAQSRKDKEIQLKGLAIIKAKGRKETEIKFKFIDESENHDTWVDDKWLFKMVFLS